MRRCEIGRLTYTGYRVYQLGVVVIVILLLLAFSPVIWALEVSTLVTQSSDGFLGIDNAVWWLIALLLSVVFLALGYGYRVAGMIKKEHTKMQAIWHHLPDTLTEVDSEGQIIALNKSFVNNLSPQQMIGTSCYAYLSDEGKALFRQHLHQALSTGQPSEYELSISFKGQIKNIHNRIIALQTDQQSHALVVTSDVTRYKSAQRILEQDKQHFERILQSKAQFLINVGQQMRAPSVLLRDTLASIKEDQLQVSSQQLDTLQASIEHLTQIVDDVALLAHSKQGEISLESVNTSLWHLVDDIEALYFPQSLPLQVNLTIQHDPLPHYIITDVFRLRQVLYNLMSGHLGICKQGKINLFIKQDQHAQELVIQFTITNDSPNEDAQSWIDYFNQNLEDAKVAALDTHHVAAFNIAQTLTGHLKGSLGARITDSGAIEQWFTLPVKRVKQQNSFSIFKQTPIVLAIKNESALAWFRVFFQSMQLPVEEADANSLPSKMSLLVSDDCQSEQCEWLWWLGDSQALSVEQGMVLTPPFRREALYYRLSDCQAAQSDVIKDVLPGRILLVEDNLNNQLVVKRTLEKLGYEVVVANNGEEGVAQFKVLEVDCIIMDIQMPIMDGIEATRQIRKLDKPYVPVIALTANSQKEIEDACFAAGMDSFLTKPISRQAIQSTLESFLGRSGPVQDTKQTM